MTLKECPFCHKSGECGVMRRVEYSDMPLHVECYNCGATGPFAKTYDEAAELWNRSGNNVERRP